MFDIITFGSAARDIYIISNDFLVVGEKKFVTGKGLCLSLGSKIDVEDIFFRTGGGGANTAATFANQGLKTAYCGMVGDDRAGWDIQEELNKIGVDAQFIKKTNKKITTHSIILTAPGKDRTILVYRGASALLSRKDINWQKLKNSKWLYLASLSGKLAGLFGELVNFAFENKIKIAVNPGNSQLKLGMEKLKPILKKIDILILNQEEASFLTKIPYQKEKEIFKKIDEICPAICVMTKGPAGAVVSDGKYLYTAKVPRAKVIDRTGAGDAFGSGFVTGLIQNPHARTKFGVGASNDMVREPHHKIVFAMQLGTANATSCLTKWGAKEGLLKKNQKWLKIKVAKTQIR